MRPTRRGWAAIALAACCLLLAAILDSAAFLLGGLAAAVGLVAAQLGFLGSLTALSTATTVAHRTTPERARVDQPVTYRVDLTVPATTAALEVAAEPPVGFATDDPGTAPLDPDEQSTTIAVTGQLPTAGTYRFDQPTLAATDSRGLFRHTFSVGPTHDLRVEPRGPRDVHVGTGGTRVGLAYGEHAADQGSAGIEPSEIRRYLPGDPTNRIDWKATARLNEPHIREFEAESDQPTVLVVDRRGSMRDGSAGSTKLDHARDLALWFTDYAERFNDPLGCWTVTDDGLGAQHLPASTPDTYRQVRTHLQTLAATPAETPLRTHRVGGAEAHRAAARTADRETAFDRTLAPFFAAARPYIARIEDRPLFRVTETALSRTAGRPLVVLATDDRERIEVRETVKAARRQGRAVVVFLLPTVLFTDRDALDLPAAYDRYVDFESFRRDLAALDGVTAFEVGPADRLQAILATAKRTRQEPTP